MWPLTGPGTKHPEVVPRLQPWKRSHRERQETGTRPDNLVPKQRWSPSFSKMFNPFSKTARAGVDYLALSSRSLEFPKGSRSMRPFFSSIPSFCKEQLRARALFTTCGLRLVQTHHFFCNKSQTFPVVTRHPDIPKVLIEHDFMHNKRTVKCRRKSVQAPPCSLGLNPL